MARTNSGSTVVSDAHLAFIVNDSVGSYVSTRVTATHGRSCSAEAMVASHGHRFAISEMATMGMVPTSICMPPDYSVVATGATSSQGHVVERYGHDVTIAAR